MRAVLVIVAWVSAGVLNAGFINAHFRVEHRSYDDVQGAREDRDFALGWSIFGGPAAVVITPFLTGFYQDGWSLSCAPVREDRSWH